MPTPCYISIEGQTQGLITAGAWYCGFLSAIHSLKVTKTRCWFSSSTTSLLFRLTHNRASLQVSVVHKPFKFTVSLNKAVPLLYNALASGEKMTTVELKWYRTSIEGKQENFFTTKLENASIVDIQCEMPHCQDPAKSDFTQNLDGLYVLPQNHVVIT